MAAATVASRVLGLVREIVTAWLFGATTAKAAYVIAYYVPFFVQRLLLGGTLSIVFIPALSRYLAQRDQREARRISGTLFSLVLLIGILMVIAGQFVAPLIIPLAAPGFAASPELVALAVELTRIIFPAMLFLALSVFVTGFLQAHQQFTVPAVAPLLFNVVIIAGTLLLGPVMGIRGLAISWILGTAAQFLVQVPSARRLGLRFLRMDLGHPAVKEIGRLAVPAMLGLAVVEINAYVGRFFASLLSPEPGVHAVAVLDYAFEVIQAPVGIFAISIATAIFPLMSRHAAADATGDLRATTSLGLRATLFAILPVAAIAIVLREPLIRLLFERGQFTGAATTAVASAVAAYAVGLPAIAAYYVVTRTFYALHDMTTPVRLGVVMIGLNAVLDYVLMQILGAPGIALATAIVSTINVGALLWILSVRLGGLEGRRLVRTAGRLAGAALLAAAVMWGAIEILGAGPGFLTTAVRLGIGAAAGGAVYLIACRLLHVVELGIVADLIRLRPAATTAR